jgi:hypothetical protein
MTKQEKHPLATWIVFIVFLLVSLLFYYFYEDDIQGRDMDAPVEVIEQIE